VQRQIRNQKRRRVMGKKDEITDYSPPTPDVFVCKPELSINSKGTAVMLHFELMDDTGKGLGKAHSLAMTADDAMGLLWLLAKIQKKHNLPKLQGRSRSPSQKEQH
jgi:hypothetical protein